MLYLIDGSSQMYRAYHAPVRTAEGGLLRNAQGTPTRTGVEPLATHAYLRATPGEIVAWFRAHDPGA